MRSVKLSEVFAFFFMALIISLAGCGGGSSSSSGGAEPPTGTETGPGLEDDEEEPGDDEPGGNPPETGTGHLLTFTGGFSSLTNFYVYNEEESFIHNPPASYLANGHWNAGPGEDQLIVQYSEIYTITTNPVYLRIYVRGGEGKRDINANPHHETDPYQVCLIDSYNPTHPDTDQCTTWGIIVDRAGGTVTFNHTPLYGFNGSGRTGTLTGTLYFPFMSP